MTTSISTLASQISLNTYQGMSTTTSASILGLETDQNVLGSTSSLLDSSIDIVEISATALDVAAAQYTGVEALSIASEEEVSYSDLATQFFGSSSEALEDDSVLSAMLTAMYSEMDLFEDGSAADAVQALIAGSV